MICLRDPMAIAPQPILLGMGGYFLITLFDGRHSLAEIREATRANSARSLPRASSKS